MGEKGQASVEAMGCIVVLVLIAAVAQFFVFDRMVRMQELRQYMSALDICNGVASELNLAGYSEGLSSQFYIPGDVAGTNYTLMVTNEYVTVDYSDKSCVRRFNALQVNYNGTAPPFALAGGTYRMNNTGGVVTIAKVS